MFPFKKISGLTAFEKSDLKKIVEAVLQVSGAEKDEDGSFSVSKKQGTENYSFIFNRYAQGISIMFNGENNITTELEGGGELSWGQSRSISYQLRGSDIGLSITRLPKFLPVIGGQSIISHPDAMAAEFLEKAQLVSPMLYQQVIEQSGLQPLPELPPTNGMPRLF